MGGTWRQVWDGPVEPSMTPTEIAAFLANLTFVPGARFRHYLDGIDAALDAARPAGWHRAGTSTIKLTLSSTDPTDGFQCFVSRIATVPPSVTPSQLARIVEGMVMEAVSHEVHEWLRYQGVPLRNPHPGNSARPLA